FGVFWVWWLNKGCHIHSGVPDPGPSRSQALPRSVSLPEVTPGDVQRGRTGTAQGAALPGHASRPLQALSQVSRRTISTASRRQAENRVPEGQKLFQEDNGLPVHLKGGAKDSLLYTTTAGLTMFGTAYALYFLLISSMPKKPN
uniref:Cytochrome c oxidase subunit 7A2, mitochondrial n=2 Tax=Catharus TaxID=9184 RepID=A0A8C3Y0X5_CATUS